MAGKPGMKGSGGARPGAGRKPKAKAVEERLEPQPQGGALKRTKREPAEVPPDTDMLTLLQQVALGYVDASPTQVRAAIAAVQYTHVKKADGGKKDDLADKAKAAGAGKFKAAPAPLKLVAGGK